MASAAEVGRYGRRLLDAFYHAGPTNDRSLNKPVWCLGCSYTNEPTPAASHTTPPTTPSATTLPSPLRPVPNTPPESSSSSFSSSLAFEESSGDGGWPPAFLDDFESRIWMTYRSGFEPIARSDDPKANAALSLRMRLKSLTDQGGFSSDTGWGCMIRSGQCLLANALVICQLGRGRSPVNLFLQPCLRGADHDAARLAPRHSSATGTRDSRSFRRRSSSTVFYTQFRQAWCRGLREVPGGVVRTFSHGPLYTVSSDLRFKAGPPPGAVLMID